MITTRFGKRSAGDGPAAGDSPGRVGTALRLGVVAALIGGAATGVVVTAAPAGAAISPVVDRTTGTVTADALPTAQIDGVAWSQTVVGDTVYVGGSFATARPAGSAPGVDTVARPNLMSYDVTTGAMTSWAPAPDNQVYAVAASPDGTRLYVGGQFTTVGGVTRQRIAAFDTATGTLLASFAPKLNYIVKALAVTNTTVYAGGSFATVGTAARNRLAAFDATSGALLPWDPNADGTVNALAVTPDGSKVIVGGAFKNLGTTPAYGLAAVDAVTAAIQPWAATATVRNAGAQSAILSLTTDGTAIYGSGYVYGGGGVLEGAFSADPTTGVVKWIEDCHGDTYGVFSTGSAVYTVSHSHYCGNVGGFPETTPRSFQHALAWTPQPTGTIGHDPYGYKDWFGAPSPSMQTWFPDLGVGTYTGVGQAAWSVAGDSRYVVLGGEFPDVNGTAQQGLVRFAVDPMAPDAQGPMVGTGEWTPTARTVSTGVRVTIPANWDRDDAMLTYTVIRNSDTHHPVSTSAAASSFWRRPNVGFVDTGLTPGATATYRIVASDPAGNKMSSTTVTGTAGATPASTYASAVIADGASHFWRLDEPTGARVDDQAGYDDLTSAGGLTRAQTGAIGGDPDTATQFSGTTTGVAATTTVADAPTVLTEEAWIKTTSTAGGRIFGFGNKSTGTSTSVDRHLYLDTSGKVYFGAYYNNSVKYSVHSGAPVNDGQWHQIVGTLGPDGLTLFVDGKRVGRTPGGTTTVPYTGYWRVGGDATWSGAQYLAGTIDDVSIYPAVLTPAQVRRHYALSGRAIAGTVPTDRYGAAVVATSPDVYLRLDDASGPSVLDSSGNGAGGTVNGGVTYRLPGPVTGSSGTAARTDGTEGSGLAVGPYAGPAEYTEELWFSTTTTRGGKLIGFGSAATGRSTTVDRHVYILTTGQLVFGTLTAGVKNTLQSPARYNDGVWHHLVATQGPAGKRLYVDDALVGSNAQTATQVFDGYWRVGGDVAWNNTAYFAGTIDEVAVYNTALTAAQVDAHYHSSPVGGLANLLPTARFTSSASALTASFDASGSGDPDGAVASYAWSFGDGTTGAGATPSHPYAAPGSYTVGLTVTDNSGGTATTSATVTVAAPNTAPTAVFSSSATGLTAGFDASGSTDTDGTVTGYSWDFGDGTTGTGAVTPHDYAATGTYAVVLTVTDDDGATASSSGQVSVTAPVVSTFATDGFGRTVTNGWGPAEVGGAWTVKGPGLASWSVGSGQGRVPVPTSYTASAELAAASALDSNSVVSVALDKVPTGGGTMLFLAARHVGTSDYRLRAKVLATGVVQVSISKVVNGVDTAVASGTVAGLTYQAGMQLRLRLLVTGTASVSLGGKVWDASTAEPVAWQVTATDTATPLGAGSTLVSAYVSGSATNGPQTWTVDDLSVVRP